MPRWLAAVLALGVNAPLFAQGGRITLELATPREAAPGPALAAPLPEGSAAFLPMTLVNPAPLPNMEGTIPAPEITAPALQPYTPLLGDEYTAADVAQKTFFENASRAAGSVEGGAAGYADPAHWREELLSERRYAAVLEKGARKLGLSALPPVQEPAIYKRFRAQAPTIHSHMMRVGILSGLIAAQMGLSPSQTLLAAWGGRLHDVGKIDPAVLAAIESPRKLTASERHSVNRHPEIGANILFQQDDIPADVRWAGMKAALGHHEAWDGSGYPSKLKGLEVPLEARIVRLADHLDAWIENRPYRGGVTLEAVLAELEKERRTFDPAVWTALMAVLSAVSS